MYNRERKGGKICRRQMRNLSETNKYKIPLLNRYFNRICIDRGLLSKTSKQVFTQRIQLQPQATQSSKHVIQHMKPSILLNQFAKSKNKLVHPTTPNKSQLHKLERCEISLPKIKVKAAEQLARNNYIIKTQLGAMNIYDILKKKAQLQQQNIQKSFQFKMFSSFISQSEQAHNQSHATQQNLIQQDSIKPYNEYHIKLMQKNPRYITRFFKLKPHLD